MWKVKSAPISLALVLATVLATVLPAIHAAMAGEHQTLTTFAAITPDYLAIQTALAGDSVAGVHEKALAIAEAATALAARFDAAQAGVQDKDAEACSKLLPQVAGSAKTLAAAEDLKAAREAFGELSEALVVYRNLVAGDNKPSVAYCPMAKHNWLQTGQAVSNPYYGAKMLRCGSIVSK